MSVPLGWQSCLTEDEAHEQEKAPKSFVIKVSPQV